MRQVQRVDHRLCLCYHHLSVEGVEHHRVEPRIEKLVAVLEGEAVFDLVQGASSSCIEEKLVQLALAGDRIVDGEQVTARPQNAPKLSDRG